MRLNDFAPQHHKGDNRRSSDSCRRRKSACCSKPDRSNNGIAAPEEDEAWPIVGVAMESDEATSAIGIGNAPLRAASHAFIRDSLNVTPRRRGYQRSSFYVH